MGCAATRSRPIPSLGVALAIAAIAAQFGRHVAERRHRSELPSASLLGGSPARCRSAADACTRRGARGRRARAVRARADRLSTDPAGSACSSPLYTVAAHTIGPAARRRPRRSSRRVARVRAHVGLVVGRRCRSASFISTVVFLSARSSSATTCAADVRVSRARRARRASRARARADRPPARAGRANAHRPRAARRRRPLRQLMIIQAGAARRSIATSTRRRPSDALRDLESHRAAGDGRDAPGARRAAHRRRRRRHAARAAAVARRRSASSSTAIPTCRSRCTETGDPPTSCPPSVELSAYRVVQEALTNVRRHAGQCAATSPSPSPRAATGCAGVEVTDDGRGASVRDQRRRPRAGRHARADGAVRRHGDRRSAPGWRVAGARHVPVAASTRGLRVIRVARSSTTRRWCAPASG